MLSRPSALRTLAPLLAVVVVLLVPASTAPVGAATGGADESAQPGVTTTTLPVDNRQVGDIIPQPNAGREPQTAGDPGGWLQVSLFFLLVAAVMVITMLVWWRSRRARQRREAAGLDPVSLARRRGEGVRQSPAGAPGADPGAPTQHPQ